MSVGCRLYGLRVEYFEYWKFSRSTPAAVYDSISTMENKKEMTVVLHSAVLVCDLEPVFRV